MRSDGPIVHIITDRAAVEGIQTAVLVLRNVVISAINGEGSILDPVRVATNDGTEESTVGLTVVKVVFRIIVANDDILLLALTVWHQERSETCTVRDQRGSDILRLDRVGLEMRVARASTRGGRSCRGCGLRKSRQAINGRSDVRLEMHPDAQK